MGKKEYLSPEFHLFLVNLFDEDVLVISDPRTPTAEVPETTIDEGVEGELF